MLCRFTFSPEWGGLICNAVCRGSGEERVVLNVGAEEFEVPWECLTLAGSKLEIGVEGRSGDGTIVFPTKFAYIGRIESGVNDEGEEANPPTPTQLEQLQAQIADKADKTDLEGKADKTALHTLSDVVAVLDNDIERTIEAVNGKADKAHTHTLDDVSGLSEALNEKQNKLVAGENIKINGNVISATGGGGGGAVSSVNGKTGAVVLNASDVGALPDDTPIPTVPTDEIAENTAARHTHGNKSVIDGITAERVENWDKALTSGVSDVTLDGNSVVNEGVAVIPKATANALGVVKVSNGLQANVATGAIWVNRCPPNQLRSTAGYIKDYQPIVPGTMDDAVRLALCDGKGQAYTADEQAAARARLGISIWDGGVE